MHNELEAKADLSWDAERFIPGMQGVIELEHLHRYHLACEISKGLTVLDIASGEGYGSFLLAKQAKKVIGVDISDQAVLHASSKYKKPNLEYKSGSCTKIPLPDDSVDVVVSFETIEHHDQHEEMFAEIRRVLRPDGVLIISSPNKTEYSDVSGFNNPFHVKEIYLEQFQALFNNHFTNIEMYGQRVATSSLIAPLRQDVSNPPLRSMWVEDNDNNLKTAAAPRMPIYYLAVASNRAIPSLANSIFECIDTDRDAGIPASSVTLYLGRDGSARYSEERTVIQRLLLSNEVQTIDLAIPQQGEPLTSLRLDPADCPSVIDFLSIDVLGPQGNILWAPDSNTKCFAKDSQMLLSPHDGLLTRVVSLGEDPNTEILIPSSVLRILSKEGGSLRLRLRARAIRKERGVLNAEDFLAFLRSTFSTIQKSGETSARNSKDNLHEAGSRERTLVDQVNKLIEQVNALQANLEKAQTAAADDRCRLIAQIEALTSRYQK